ncbi:MAG: c-type cytochrome, partial [Cyclobacteriaceae bacterium]|nr:c-type cytochrome [Cyclobacteriaceae bacterium]
MTRKSLLYSITNIALGIALLLSFNSAYAQEELLSTDEAVISAGQQLFEANCKTCHRVHEKYVGPALQNVYNRAPSIDWIKTFIKNPTKVINSGDQYANDLYNEYKTIMTGFPFEDDQIVSILSYIKAETDKGPAEVVTAAPGDAAVAADQGGQAASGFMNTILIGLVVVLVLLFVVLILIMTVLKKYLSQQADEFSEEENEIINKGFSISGTLKSKPFIFLATFIFVSIAVKGIIMNLYAIGVQKNYAPEQPIAFSHKIHAGQFEIDCNYCHTGVRKSKSANIPSPNICMNCHSSILTSSKEVQKIWEAVEKDEPIQWVRVHNLPDL